MFNEDLRLSEYIVDLETALYNILKAQNINIIVWDHENRGPCNYGHAKSDDLKIGYLDELRKKFDHLLINGPSKIEYSYDNII